MDQAIEQANNIVDKMYNSDAGKEYCNLFKKLHKQMLLTLIEIMYINFSSKLGANKKIEQYFSYVNDILGIYMDREVVIAHKYFSKNSDIQIFKRVNKNMKKDKLRDVLNNVAWDFTISRIMEMVMMSCGEGDFFVPIFLSFDRDLRSVMNSFPIKGILINFNELKVIPIPSINTKEYFIKNNCYDYLEKLFAPTLPESRIKTYRDNESSDYVIIEQEFEKLVNVLCSG